MPERKGKDKETAAGDGDRTKKDEGEGQNKGSRANIKIVAEKEKRDKHMQMAETANKVKEGPKGRDGTMEVQGQCECRSMLLLAEAYGRVIG